MKWNGCSELYTYQMDLGIRYDRSIKDNEINTTEAISVTERFTVQVQNMVFLTLIITINY